MTDFTGCYATAQSEAEGELAGILSQVRAQFAGSPADLSALAAVRTAHCHMTQALRRAQALWAS